MILTMTMTLERFSPLPSTMTQGGRPLSQLLMLQPRNLRCQLNPKSRKRSSSLAEPKHDLMHVNLFCFTMLMAGGGLKGGMTYGETDEIGWEIADKPVHVNDLHATMLHQFGLDHLKLTYRFQGRDFRLTDVGGKVIHDWIA